MVFIDFQNFGAKNTRFFANAAKIWGKIYSNQYYNI